MPALNVYGWYSHREECQPDRDGSKVTREIVAAESRATVLRMLDSTGSPRPIFSSEITITTIADELRAAMANPGIILWRPVCSNHGGPWYGTGTDGSSITIHRRVIAADFIQREDCPDRGQLAAVEAALKEAGVPQAVTVDSALRSNGKVTSSTIDDRVRWLAQREEQARQTLDMVADELTRRGFNPDGEYHGDVLMALQTLFASRGW